MKGSELAQLVTELLSDVANPDDAGPMQAYMKTEMPFLGVKKPARIGVERAIARRWTPPDPTAYESAVRAVWALPHREEKYLAISLARRWKRFIVPASLPLYETLIREGAWWDFVDEVAINLVGTLWQEHRDWFSPIADRWIADPDPWIRRSAIIGQLKHKTETDIERLLGYCSRCASETGFFTRKAIGWALREYSKTDAQLVVDYVGDRGDALSGLSRREALKWLKARARV